MKKAPQKKTRVPAALAKNAAEISKQALARVAAAARADIAFIKERKESIAAAFYDIGEALVRLKKKGVAQALGYRTFEEICEREIGIGVTQAGELIDIVTRLTRDDAIQMGQTKAGAFSRLAEATPAPDTPVELFEKGVRTPSGKRVSAASPTREVEAAAKEFRQASRGTKRGRGRTTTPDERSIAAAIQKKLHAAGITTARVTAVATKSGKPANLRIEGVPMPERKKIATALR